MKVYDVGSDELGFVDEGFEWIVYSYRQDYYEGYGEGIALKIENGVAMLYKADFGHCSCYGPLDAGFYLMAPVDKFLNELNQVHGYVSYKEVEEKVVELLTWREIKK